LNQLELCWSTATISFWAKAGIQELLKLRLELGQVLEQVVHLQAAVKLMLVKLLFQLLGRYSVTVAVPSISGKTIGTNDSDIYA
jgi:hypothetical protein